MSSLVSYDQLAVQFSRQITRKYSTSFALGIRMLHRDLRHAIYAIYGFVRLADEIVDSFQGYDQRELLSRFQEDTWTAIGQKISLNPVLHSFQATVLRYAIDPALIRQFLQSMEMDLDPQTYDSSRFRTYIVGSAEVVGLMCLTVFCEGDRTRYEALRPYAMRLGSAFQKVNFLRDLRTDLQILGRSYFPGVDPSHFSEADKQAIIADVENDFAEAFRGIRMLPKKSRFGVYLAYVYYFALFNKIKRVPSTRMLEERIRIPNTRKAGLLAYSYLRHQLNWL